MRIFKIKKCKHCGTDFQPSNGRHNFCSAVCRIKDNVTIDSNNCWNWPDGKIKSGYGQVNFNGETRLAHRVMCESVHGSAPTDKPNALHSCDNPSCCNPDHLRWGSQQENMNDMKERDRTPCGEDHFRSKLTEKQVIEIIDKLKNYKQGDGKKLAKEYNIDNSVISDIHNNKIWKHIPR